MKKSKLLRLTALFFVLMLCFTVLSRAAYQSGTAVVKTGKPENRTINHQIRVMGKVVENQELAVFTEPNQRVTGIYVKEGQRVAKGELLFEIDTTLLEESILNQKQEMEKQQLQVKDARSQKDISAMQKANDQAQAAENYSLNVNSAGARLQRAKRDLNKANQELEDFRKNNGSAPSDGQVQESLEQQYQEKQEAYIQAEQELTTLQWQIENAVDQALTQAKGSMTREAGLTAAEPTLTQSQELIEEPGLETGYDQGGFLEEREETVILEMQASAAASTVPETPIEPMIQESQTPAPLAPVPETVLQETQPSVSSPSVPETSAPVPETVIPENQNPSTELVVPETAAPSTDPVIPETPGSEEGGWTDPDFIIEDLEPGEGLQDPGSDGSQWDDTGSLNGGAGLEDQEPDLDGSVSGDVGPTQEELDKIEAGVRASYAQKLEAAKKKVETANQEKESAREALEAYQQEKLAAMDAANAKTEQQLLEQVQAARDAYEDAAIAANEAAVASSRAVAGAGIPNASNSSDRMNEITYEQMELVLEKLEKLMEERGRITAPADGLITKIQITTGEKTTDTTAILMADLSRGYSFTAQITGEQEKYLGTGDLVTLTGGSKKKTLEDLPVTGVQADDEQEEVYHVTVELPEEAFEIGTAVTLEFTKKSELYPSCVPLSALYLDSRNQPYVLTVEERDTIMGTEWKTRKVSVTVLEQNETYAALAEGGLASSQEIIVSSDKPVEEGSRVRIGSGE